jgi:hypothetical protein
MTINTTKLTLPKIILNVPEITFTYTTKRINLEAYAVLPTCDEIPDITSYLGYNLNILHYEWSLVNTSHKIDQETFFKS